MKKSIKAKVIDSCIKVIVDRPVIRSHHLVRKIPSYFDEVESRCQSNQEARPASTPICSLYRTPQMSAVTCKTNRDWFWRGLHMDDATWSVSGLARWTGVLLCHPICRPSATWDIRSRRKKVMCWIPSTMMMMISNGQITHLIIAIIRTPRVYKSYWPWFVSKVLLDSKWNRGSSVRNT